METVGRFVGASVDWQTKKRVITFEVDWCTDEELQNIASCEALSIKAVKYRRKRSKDANAYFWVLLGKLALAIPGTNTDFLHDQYLARHICFVMQEGEEIPEWLVSKQEPNEHGFIRLRDGGGWRYYKDSGHRVRLDNEQGKPYKAKGAGEQIGNIFWRIKGTHEMDTKEMSALIDDVVQDAKAAGIETMPPAEIERMVAAWGR